MEMRLYRPLSLPKMCEFFAKIVRKKCEKNANFLRKKCEKVALKKDGGLCKNRAKRKRRMQDMEDTISRREHDEFAKRIEAEEHRQNRRIELLEESVKQNAELTLSVGKLASSVEQMAKEQAHQGERLETLESRDGEMWRKGTG